VKSLVVGPDTVNSEQDDIDDDDDDDDNRYTTSFHYSVSLSDSSPLPVSVGSVCFLVHFAAILIDCNMLGASIVCHFISNHSHFYVKFYVLITC